MILEGNMLIGVLVVATVAIAALLVYIRFVVKREPSGEGSLFSRLFGSGDDDEEEADAADAVAAPADAGAGGSAPDGIGLSIPGLDPGDSPAPEKAAEAAPSGSSFSIGGMIGGLLGGRKNKTQIKEEVRVIDEQLNNVMQEAETISAAGVPPPQINPLSPPGGDTAFSEGRGMRELDMEMGAAGPVFDALRPEELKLEPPVPDPMAAPPAPQAADATAAASSDSKKADAPQEPAAPDPAKMPDFTDSSKKTAGDDLLSDLEASTKQEQEIDMSIMKEFKDMPLTCVELESDLKNILDQITINGQGRKGAQ